MPINKGPDIRKNETDVSPYAAKMKTNLVQNPHRAIDYFKNMVWTSNKGISTVNSIIQLFQELI